MVETPEGETAKEAQGRAFTRSVRDADALGRAVRSIRRARGLTQAELAGLAGVGVRYLSELERGKTTSHLGKALTVLHRLGCRLTLEARLPGAK